MYFPAMDNHNQKAHNMNRKIQYICLKEIKGESKIERFG